MHEKYLTLLFTRKIGLLLFFLIAASGSIGSQALTGSTMFFGTKPPSPPQTLFEIEGQSFTALNDFLGAAAKKPAAPTSMSVKYTYQLIPNNTGVWLLTAQFPISGTRYVQQPDSSWKTGADAAVGVSVVLMHANITQAGGNKSANDEELAVEKTMDTVMTDPGVAAADKQSTINTDVSSQVGNDAKANSYSISPQFFVGLGATLGPAIDSAGDAALSGTVGGIIGFWQADVLIGVDLLQKNAFVVQVGAKLDSFDFGFGNWTTKILNAPQYTEATATVKAPFSASKAGMVLAPQ